MGRGMSAVELMAKLQSAGIKLQVRGNKLRYCPRWAVSPALRLQLIRRKEEILSYLSCACTPQQELDSSLLGFECQQCFHCAGSGQCFQQCCGLPPMFDSRRQFLCRACQGQGYLRFLFVH